MEKIVTFLLSFLVILIIDVGTANAVDNEIENKTELNLKIDNPAIVADQTVAVINMDYQHVEELNVLKHVDIKGLEFAATISNQIESATIGRYRKSKFLYNVDAYLNDELIQTTFSQDISIGRYRETKFISITLYPTGGFNSISPNV